MISYDNKKSTPKRMARKRARQTTFLANRKESKIRRQQRREARG